MKKLAIVKITEPTSPLFRQVFTCVGIIPFSLVGAAGYQSLAFLLVSDAGEKRICECRAFAVLHLFIPQDEWDAMFNVSGPKTEARPESQYEAETNHDLEDGEWWKRGEKPFGDAT